MKVLHIINSYVLKDGIPAKDVFQVAKGFQDYRVFLSVLKSVRPEIIHIHSVGSETFGIYALIARFTKIKVIRTLHAPIQISNWYIVKQLSARAFFSHTIATSKYDLMYIDKYHLAGKSKRALIYQGLDAKKYIEYHKKDASRLHVYKQLGISFTKNIRIIGTIVKDDSNNGLEHLIDAAYLADKYKNLTNTVFMILSRGTIPQEIKDQIAELHVEGICLVLENFENPEEYIKAFDVFISPRTKAGDLDMLLHAMYLRVPVIATKVGDAKEFEQYVAAPLVPVESAKFLTEATMYVIKNENPTALKNLEKNFELSKKFTTENEFTSTHEIYSKVLKRKLVSRGHTR